MGTGGTRPLPLSSAHAESPQPERPGVARGAERAKPGLPERVTQHCLAGCGCRGACAGWRGRAAFPRWGPPRGDARRGAWAGRFHPACQQLSSLPTQPQACLQLPPHREAPGEAAGGGRAFPRLYERVWGQRAGTGTRGKEEAGSSALPSLYSRIFRIMARGNRVEIPGLFKAGKPCRIHIILLGPAGQGRPTLSPQESVSFFFFF